MKRTIFDAIQEDIPLTGKKGFFQESEKANEENGFLRTIKDYGKTAVKGLLEGVTRFGRAFGPMYNLQGNKPEEEMLEEQTEMLNEALPTEDDFGQRALRRGLQILPTAVGPGAGKALVQAPLALASGLAGETTKELGAPEWVQSAAEITTMLSPAVTKKLLSAGSNKEIIDAARKIGMSDAQIAPLIQPEIKQKWLSKIANKRGLTQQALRKTKTGLDEGYQFIKNSESAKQILPSNQKEEVFKKIEMQLKEMPSSVRKTIKTDLKDLKKSNLSGSDLINFYADINHELGPNTKQLSTLKPIIKESLSSISPELGKDFEMVNLLYTKYYPIASKLKPTLASDIVSSAEALGTVYSLVTGNYPYLTSIAGEKAARALASQALVNPRYQQLSRKFIHALNDAKPVVAKKIADAIAYEVVKTSPEIAKEMQKLTLEDLEELLSKHQKKAAK